MSEVKCFRCPNHTVAELKQETIRYNCRADGLPHVATYATFYCTKCGRMWQEYLSDTVEITGITFENMHSRQ